MSKKKLPPEFHVERHPDNTAIDVNRRILPMTSDQVARHMEIIIEKGDVVMAVFVYQDELAVQTFSAPSLALAELLRNPDTSDAWVIWSFEHDEWWMPNRRGYTIHLHEAGVYTQDEANEIVDTANVGASWEHERAMTLQDARKFGPPRP